MLLFGCFGLQRHLGSLSTASLAYFHNIPLALRANILDIIAHRSRNLVEVFCANLCSMNLGGAVSKPGSYNVTLRKLIVRNMLALFLLNRDLNS